MKWDDPKAESSILNFDEWTEAACTEERSYIGG